MFKFGTFRLLSSYSAFQYLDILVFSFHLIPRSVLGYVGKALTRVD